MKILAISDLHGIRDHVESLAGISKQENVDVITISGDLTNFGDSKIGYSIVDSFQVLAEVPVLWVPGNCDPKIQKDINRGEAVTEKCIFRDSKVIKDVLFLGPDLGSREDVHAYLKENPPAKFNAITSIWVSHYPPKSTKTDRTWSSMHVGSHLLREMIESYTPSVVLCGHIHESRAIDNINKTLVVNPGPAMNGNYGLVEDSKGEWKATLGQLAKK